MSEKMAMKLVCVDDYEAEARKLVPENYWAYLSSGTDGHVTLKDNTEAFRRLKIKQRILRQKTAGMDLTTSVLGRKISFPLGISPTASPCWYAKDGDVAIAQAATANNIPMTTGLFANLDMESLRKVTPDAFLWFQFLAVKDQNATEYLVRKVERAGYEALVWTVNAVPFGRKRGPERRRFDYNDNSKCPNWDAARFGEATVENCAENITWDTLKWLKTITKLPIIIKGILSPEDAALAVEYGASAVWVSNHGGRQLDGVPATIDVLPEIAKAVQGRIDIYLDGGIRNGTDILKAIALGATAAFIGRPVLWGLSCEGSDGVRRVLDILKEEFSDALRLSGCRKINDVTPSLVLRKYYYANL